MGAAPAGVAPHLLMDEQEQSGSVVQIRQFKCLRCGWEWNGRPTRRGSRPRCCSYCKSSYWDRPGATRRAMSPDKYNGKRKPGAKQSKEYIKQNYQLNRLRHWIRKLGLEVARLEFEKMEFAEGERRLETKVKPPEKFVYDGFEPGPLVEYKMPTFTTPEGKSEEKVLIPPPPGIHGS